MAIDEDAQFKADAIWENNFQIIDGVQAQKVTSG
jgi:hypothetical protein